ncbi:hypothetical protein JW824_05495 [bacterium]|nr:hypothetical protein [bacterium]
MMGVFIIPDEQIAIQIVGDEKTDTYEIYLSGGSITSLDKNEWRFQPPQNPGLYPITIIRSAMQDSMILNVFVMVPYKELKGEYLNGYRIGEYPTTLLNELLIYSPPKGFIEVTKENEDTFISPHFQLKSFVSKQDGDYPKYVVLRERLLLKLELILEKINEKGYACGTLHIMSGYRTPYYNKLIGNVKYSRHVWGGAADIFVDVNPRDGMMDDLNQDGQINYHDAEIIYDIIDKMYGRPFYEMFIGGLGWYRRTLSHGPFVHVDVRGFRARW